jgi:hypothetical protein
MEYQLRKCFISYHHESQEKYLIKLRDLIYEMQVADHSLKDDISYLSTETIYKTVRKKMRGCSITIILVGEMTGYRKWIDWEIWASLRPYRHPVNPLLSFKPNGLLVIFLPGKNHSIPKRLQDNIDSGYAVCMKWENLERDFESKINYAYWNRTNRLANIDNSRKLMERNRSFSLN